MNALSLLGLTILMALIPVAPFVIARWARLVVDAYRAINVLQREQRAGESLVQTAEALAGDAHKWRGYEDERFGSGCAGDAIVDDESVVVSPSSVECVDDPILQELSRYYTETQPPPQNSSGPALWPLIISELGDSETDRLVAADMQARHEFGVAKYGVPLVASNGRDHFADAYQEALDGVVYLRAELEKLIDRVSEHQVSPEDYKAHGRVSQLYIDMLDLAKELREVIAERDGR